MVEAARPPPGLRLAEHLERLLSPGVPRRGGDPPLLLELGGEAVGGGVAVTEFLLLEDGGRQSETVALSVAVSELPCQPVGLNIVMTINVDEGVRKMMYYDILGQLFCDLDPVNYKT